MLHLVQIVSSRNIGDVIRRLHGIVFKCCGEIDWSAFLRTCNDLFLENCLQTSLTIIVDCACAKMLAIISADRRDPGSGT
jgi:hypothetical protein